MKYQGQNETHRMKEDSRMMHLDRVTMSPEEFAKTYFDLSNKVKVCSCGKVHTKVRRADAKENELGLWWNCECKSTLFIKKGGY